MRVRIVETRMGTMDDVPFELFHQGMTFDLPASLAEILILQGWAEPERPDAESSTVDHPTFNLQSASTDKSRMLDREVWRLYGVSLEVRATIREIRDQARAGSWDGNLIGLELRIEQGGELRQSELFRDRQALDDRSQTIYDMLVEKGWRPVQ